MRAQDTIAAIATPPGVGGIAILRLSGPEAERILTALCGRARWESHRLYYCRLRHAGRTLDEAMAVLMRAPRSYTRQDVAEIQCHGGEVVCRNVLEAALALGARPAQPGEFTRRAFENGRIDLAQAEAAMRLIGAQGEAAAREALRQMEGSVSRGVHAACDRLNAMLSEIAACTDFPDEIEEAPTARALCAQAKELAAALRAACDARRGRVLEQGLNVVLCGAPNVGKSSLLNALLGEARAIVTAQPGTTRDAVRGSLFLDGVRVHLTDTAGLRETEGEAEAIGVARAREAAEAADVLLLVLDGTRAPDARERELLAAAAGPAGAFEQMRPAAGGRASRGPRRVGADRRGHRRPARRAARHDGHHPAGRRAADPGAPCGGGAARGRLPGRDGRGAGSGAAGGFCGGGRARSARGAG